MARFQGKHIIEVIDGVRCSLIESAISEKRMEFLKSILEFSGYQVKTSPDDGDSWKLGVTDLLFNTVIEVYKRTLHTPNGHIVTPAYWLQLTDRQTEGEVNYWNVKESLRVTRDA